MIWSIPEQEVAKVKMALDVGCGRGLGIVLLAKRLISIQGSSANATLYGIDIWQSFDQANNAMNHTLQNTELEGVSHLIRLQTADARTLPFLADSMELVISSLTIHNILEPKMFTDEARLERNIALAEIVRVLKPGGLVSIWDFVADTYADYFRQNPLMQNVTETPLRTFGLWDTYLVTARKRLSLLGGDGKYVHDINSKDLII